MKRFQDLRFFIVWVYLAAILGLMLGASMSKQLTPETHPFSLIEGILASGSIILWMILTGFYVITVMASKERSDLAAVLATAAYAIASLIFFFLPEEGDTYTHPLIVELSGNFLLYIFPIYIVADAFIMHYFGSNYTQSASYS